MRTRTEHLAALADVTADDIARDLDSATEPDDYWTALHAALLHLGWHGMKEAPEEKPVLLRIPAAPGPVRTHHQRSHEDRGGA